MVTIDEVIKFVEKEYEYFLSLEHSTHEEIRDYEAVMTILSTLEYSKLLTDKFGSLEEALEAEKVTHCWECAMWKPERGICNKPYESMRGRCPHEYCSDGRYYRKSDEDIMKRLAEYSDLFAREYILPAETIKAAIERNKEV